MNIFFWRKDKTESTGEVTIKEIKETTRKAEWKEYERRNKKGERGREKTRKEVERIIREEVPRLITRSLEAAKEGRESLRVIRLEKRHLQTGLSLREVSNEATHSLSFIFYEDVIGDSLLLEKLIPILEKIGGNGFRVLVEVDKDSKRAILEDLIGSSWFRPRVYLTINW